MKKTSLFLTSAPNATILQARVDARCKGRTIGESLTLSMLYTVLEALENDDGDFAEDVAVINKDRLHHRTLLSVLLLPPIHAFHATT